MNSNPRILIVDDETLTRYMIKMRVVNMGYQCSAVSTPQEAIDLLKKDRV